MNSIPFDKIDKSWTLFLDRDGVINKRLPNRYVRQWEEFEFYEKVLEALNVFNKCFGLIVIVTNQQGVGKGLMTAEDLSVIHDKMIQQIEESGGRIDQVFYCAKKKDDLDNCRKPNPHMGLLAKEIYPNIDFNKSIMIGDSISDVEFGKNLKMRTVFVETKKEEYLESLGMEIDYRCSNLFEFANQLIT